MNEQWICPRCQSTNKILHEYKMTSQDYDGISEIRCVDCGYREGRWSGLELKEGYIERRYGGKPVSIK
jgi:Zn ribbon nucleic-acid-binding protein